jgi:hypothetical protein
MFVVAGSVFLHLALNEKYRYHQIELHKMNSNHASSIHQLSSRGDLVYVTF